MIGVGRNKQRKKLLKQLKKTNATLLKDAALVVSRSTITRGSNPTEMLWNGGSSDDWVYVKREYVARLNTHFLLDIVDGRGPIDDLHPVHRQRKFISPRMADCPYAEINVPVAIQEERNRMLEAIQDNYVKAVARNNDLLARHAITDLVWNERMLVAKDNRESALEHYRVHGLRNINLTTQKEGSIQSQNRKIWIDKRKDAFKILVDGLGPNVIRELNTAILAGDPVGLWEALHWKYYNLVSNNTTVLDSINEWLATCTFNPQLHSWSTFKDEFEDNINRGRELGVDHNETSQLGILVKALQRGSNKFKDDITYVLQSRGTLADLMAKVHDRVQSLVTAAAKQDRENELQSALQASFNTTVKDTTLVSKDKCWDCDSPHHKRGDPSCPKRKKGGGGSGKSGGGSGNSGSNNNQYCSKCKTNRHDCSRCFFNKKVYPDGPPFKTKKRKHASDDSDSSDAGEASSSSRGNKSIVGSEHWRGKSGKAHAASNSSSSSSDKKAAKKARNVTFGGKDGDSEEHTASLAVFKRVTHRVLHVVKDGITSSVSCCR
jgi:hypothetical protein